MTPGDHHTDFVRQLDADRYSVRLSYSGRASITEEKAHTYLLSPGKDEDTLDFVCTFFPANSTANSPAQNDKVLLTYANHSGGKRCPLAALLAERRSDRSFGKQGSGVGKNLSGESSSRNIYSPYRKPVHCRLKKADCSTTVAHGTASFISKCIGGMARTTPFGIAGRCSNAVSTGIEKYCHPPGKPQKNRAIAAHAGQKWSDPKDAIRPPASALC